MKEWQYQALVKAVGDACIEILKKGGQKNETLPKDKTKSDD